jgi:hypothetical protein
VNELIADINSLFSFAPLVSKIVHFFEPMMIHAGHILPPRWARENFHHEIAQAGGHLMKLHKPPNHESSQHDVALDNAMSALGPPRRSFRPPNSRRNSFQLLFPVAGFNHPNSVSVTRFKFSRGITSCAASAQ